MVHITKSTLLVAALAAAPVLSAPAVSSEERQFARSLNQFDTRASRAAQNAVKNVVESVGQSKMKDAVKKYTSPDPVVDPKLQEAAKKSSPPFSQSSVDHVVKGHGKRSFEEYLEARASRAAQNAVKNVVESVGQSKMKDAVKKYTNSDPVVDPKLQEAAKKSSPPFSQSSVDHVVKGHGKRSFEEYLEARASRAAQNAVKNVVESVGQSKMKDAVKKYTNSDPVVDPKLQEAAKKSSPPFSQSSVDHVVKGHGKRSFEEYLEARASRAAQNAVKNVVESVGQSKMKDAVKKYTNSDPVVDPKLQEAAKKSSPPFSQSSVDHVVKGHGKRSFEEYLEARASRAAQNAVKNVVESVGQSKMKDAVKKYTNSDPVVDPKLQEAAKKSSPPFSQSSVDHVVKGHGKRSFEEYLEARASRAAQNAVKNVVESVGQSKMKDAVKKYTNSDPVVDPKLQEAAKKSSPPFSQSSVDHVVKGHGKRSFEDYLEARASRAAQNAVKNVVESVGQSKMKEAVKKYTNSDPVVDPKLQEAAKKSSPPFSQSSVDHVVKGHGKRSFEEYLEARASRAAQNAVKNVVESVGQSKMKEAVKKYTNSDPVVDPKLQEAAKKSSPPFSQSSVDHVVKGHGKRSFEDMDLYGRDYEDFEGVFEREFDDLEERYYDDLEEREFYYLNELD